MTQNHRIYEKDLDCMGLTNITAHPGLNIGLNIWNDMCIVL